MSVDFAEKKRTQRERVLDVLLDLQWHPYMDLNAVGGVRYSARLLELKRLGYEIEDRTVKDGGGKDYRLKSPLPRKTPQAKMVKVFLKEEEAEAILARLRGLHYRAPHRTYEGARSAVENALGSFRANRHKL